LLPKSDVPDVLPKSDVVLLAPPNNDGAVVAAVLEPNKDGAEAAVLEPNREGAVDVAVLEPNNDGAVDVAAVFDPNIEGCDVFVPNPPVPCVDPNNPVVFAGCVMAVLVAPNPPKLGAAAVEVAGALAPNPNPEVVEVAGALLPAPNPKLGAVDEAGTALDPPNENALDAGADAVDPKVPAVLVPKPPPKDEVVDVAGCAPNVKAMIQHANMNESMIRRLSATQLHARQDFFSFFAPGKDCVFGQVDPHRRHHTRLIFIVPTICILLIIGQVNINIYCCFARCCIAVNEKKLSYKSR
jgi:hypothetical protein